MGCDEGLWDVAFLLVETVHVQLVHVLSRLLHWLLVPLLTFLSLATSSPPPEAEWPIFDPTPSEQRSALPLNQFHAYAYYFPCLKIKTVKACYHLCGEVLKFQLGNLRRSLWWSLTGMFCRYLTIHCKNSVIIH